MASIRPLSTELQRIAEEELNEVKSRIPEDIKFIRSWLAKQPHLTIRSDDQWLVTFLRGCKYSLEKTKTKLDLYYSIRPIMPEYFRGRYPFSPALNEILKLRSFTVLPSTSTGATRCLLSWDVCDSDNCTLIDHLKFWLMCIEILLVEDDNTIISGVEFIVDFSRFTLNYATQFTPTIVKNVIRSVEGAFPVRIKGIYIINAPPIFETIYSMAKVFMSNKLKSRMHIYSSESINDLYKHIPKHVLPKEYGGDNISVNKLAADFNKKIESYGEWFLDDEKYGSNESLRPTTTKQPESIVELQGSFRKLNVD